MKQVEGCKIALRYASEDSKSNVLRPLWQVDHVNVRHNDFQTLRNGY